MAVPRFAPVAPLDDARGYESPPHVPDGWTSDRPADLTGRQPQGTRLGFQGPDQGYALTLAALVRPQVRVPAGESVEDALAAATAIGLRRASLFGRAPVIHDVRIALTIWGLLDGQPPADLVELRRTAFEGVADTAHHYEALRAIVDSVPEPTLRMSPAQVSSSYPGSWRALLGR